MESFKFPNKLRFELNTYFEPPLVNLQQTALFIRIFGSIRSFAKKSNQIFRPYVYVARSYKTKKHSILTDFAGGL